MLNILKFLANMSVQPVRLLVTCAQYIYIFFCEFQDLRFWRWLIGWLTHSHGMQRISVFLLYRHWKTPWRKFKENNFTYTTTEIFSYSANNGLHNLWNCTKLTEGGATSLRFFPIWCARNISSKIPTKSAVTYS